jgi:PHD/YefM family antitoxin component YafN of YafNO toxin-antitoxin module
MDFYTVRDLRTTPKSLWESLSSNGEVVITRNGKPKAILLDIADNNLEETLKAIRQALAVMAFNTIKASAARKGYMSEEEIELEIAAARKGE